MEIHRGGKASGFAWGQCRGAIGMYLGVCVFVFMKLQLTVGSWSMTNTNSWEKLRSPLSCIMSIVTNYYYYGGTWQRYIHVWKPLQSFTVKLKFKFKSLMCTTPCWLCL